MLSAILKEEPGERSFVSGTREGNHVTNHALVAALSALGIEFDTKPSTLVVGDGIAGDGRVSYYFHEASKCGKYKTAEMIAAWENPTWHEKHPHHPFSYIKCGLLNLFELEDSLIKDTPLGLIRKGKKVALISLNASRAFEEKIFKRLERGR